MAKNASVETTVYSNLDDKTLIAEWDKTAKYAATWKYKEAALREEVVKRIFANDITAGTYNYELGLGYKLKCVKKDTYTPVTKKTNPDDITINDALQRIGEMGNEGKFIVGRIIKWKPELSLTEYKNLSDDMKKIITDALIIKPAMPTLEIIEPKKR